MQKSGDPEVADQLSTMWFHVMILSYRKTGATKKYYTGRNGGNAWLYTTINANSGADTRSYKELPSPIIDSSQMYFSLGWYYNYETNRGGNPEWPCRIAQRYDFKAKSVALLGPVIDVAQCLALQGSYRNVLMMGGNCYGTYMTKAQMTPATGCNSQCPSGEVCGGTNKQFSLYTARSTVNQNTYSIQGQSPEYKLRAATPYIQED